MLFFLGAVRPSVTSRDLMKDCYPVNHQHDPLWTDNTGALHTPPPEALLEELNFEVPQPCGPLPLLIVATGDNDKPLTVVFDIGALLEDLHIRHRDMTASITYTMPYVYRRVQESYDYEDMELEWVNVSHFLLRDEEAKEVKGNDLDREEAKEGDNPDEAVKEAEGDDPDEEVKEAKSEAKPEVAVSSNVIVKVTMNLFLFDID